MSASDSKDIKMKIINEKVELYKEMVEFARKEIKRDDRLIHEQTQCRQQHENQLKDFTKKLEAAIGERDAHVNLVNLTPHISQVSLASTQNGTTISTASSDGNASATTANSPRERMVMLGAGVLSPDRDTDGQPQQEEQLVQLWPNHPTPANSGNDENSQILTARSSASSSSEYSHESYPGEISVEVEETQGSGTSSLSNASVASSRSQAGSEGEENGNLETAVAPGFEVVQRLGVCFPTSRIVKKSAQKFSIEIYNSSSGNRWIHYKNGAALTRMKLEPKERKTIHLLSQFITKEKTFPFDVISRNGASERHALDVLFMSELYNTDRVNNTLTFTNNGPLVCSVHPNKGHVADCSSSTP